MKIIGRDREKDVLSKCLSSKRPEFVVVYGRRRVGKTFLIKEFFNGQFSFYATGLSDEKTKGQVKAFHASPIMDVCLLHFAESKRLFCVLRRVEKRGKQRNLLSSSLIFRPKTSKIGRKRKALDERGSHEIV